MNSPRYMMKAEYDGTNYGGWQRQQNALTVQGEIEKSILKITEQACTIHASGRTDSGVHSHGHPFHFNLETRMPINKLQTAMNAILPADIRLSGVRKVAPEFHCRFDAVGKEYRYYIYNGPSMPPFERLYRHFYPGGLDLEAMQEAASHLVGRNDFAAFSANPHRDMHGTVRDVWDIELNKRGRLITVQVRGSGFLYKMVRSLVGYLLRVGAGQLEPARALEIFQSGIRTAEVPTAPARGLYLWEVYYDPAVVPEVYAKDPLIRRQ